MKLVYEEQFKIALSEILIYIAKDKVSASRNFQKELKSIIVVLVENPKMYRKSYYFEDKNYRDLTYMSYTIIYKITPDSIRILDIFKWQDR
jgi:plasmid stabilization system protein ParE